MPRNRHGAQRPRPRQRSQARGRRRCHTHIPQLLLSLEHCLPTSLHLQEMFQEVSRGAVQLFQVSAASLWGVDEAAQRLYLHSYAGAGLSEVALPPSIALQQDVVGWVARQQQPLFVTNILTERRCLPLPYWAQHGWRSCAGFPLLLEERVRAVLALHGTARFPWSTFRHHLMRFFLAHVCRAWQRAHLYESESRTRESAEASLYAQAAMAVRSASLYATESMNRNALEAASRTKNTLLANMSHELRTPLNAIINYSEILQEDATEQGHPGYVPDLKKIQLAGKTLLAHINDILDFARVEAGDVYIQCDTFDIADLIADVLALLRPLAAKNANALEAHVETGLSLVCGDRTKIQQSLVHLVSNACKFTSQGQITLSVSREQCEAQTWLRFQIRDTGIGMSPEQVARLFQPFMQGDDSLTRKYGGTGMGLAISQRLCQIMGGEITVTSTVGQGSTFTMYLPSVEHTTPAVP
ncbi:MAG: ATP-binding protein [Candidatus Tectimicrobiota bacterium]